MWRGKHFGEFGKTKEFANFSPTFKTLSSICGHLLWNKSHHMKIEQTEENSLRILCMSHCATLSSNRLLMTTVCVSVS